LISYLGCRTNVLDPILILNRIAALPSTNEQMQIGLLAVGGSHEQIVDVCLAVADANDCGFNARYSSFLGPPKSFDPADTFLIFDRSLAAFLSLLGFGGSTNLFSRPAFLPDDTQWHPSGIKGDHGMKEGTSSAFRVHRSSTFHLLLGPGKVELGGILNQQRKVNRVNPTVRRFDVRLEDTIRSDRIIIEEPIGAFDFGLRL
jgi:hypothetical protein